MIAITPADTLIVPVNLQALAVTDEAIKAGLTLRGALTDFSPLGGYETDGSGGTRRVAFYAENVRALSASGPVVGVHLHWALPDGTTRGAYDPDDKSAATSVRFDRAPDRWLVTRVALRVRDNEVRIKSWVVASDQLHADGPADGATAPAPEPGPDTRFRNLGRVYDYDQWVSAPAAAPGRTGNDDPIPLTALGPGHVAFSAYYPSSRNVLGLFDAFTQTLVQEDGGGPGFGPDTSKALGDHYRLTYLVVGWFEDASVDPLHPGNKTLTPCRPPTGWQPTRSTLPWTFDGDGTPSASLYSGMIQGVEWDPGASLGWLSAADSPIEVAIGNNAAEALSVLVAKQSDMAGDVDAELLLDAVQAGVVLREAGGSEAAKLHGVLHGNAFSGVSGGSLWVVKPPRPVLNGGVGADDTEATLPDTLAGALNRLNTAQQRYDVARTRLEDMSRLIFEDWYRFMLRRDSPDRADLETFLQVQASPQGGAWSTFAAFCGVLAFDEKGVPSAGPSGKDSLAAAAVSAWQAVRTLLAGSTGAYQLLRTPAPRYWQPNEPVVLLRGKDVAPVDRWGRGDSLLRPGLLACRRGDQVVGPLRHTRSGATLGAAAIAGRMTYDRVPMGDIALALLAEARLMRGPEAPSAEAPSPHTLSLVDLLAHATGERDDAARRELVDLATAFARGETSTGALTCAGRLPAALACTDGSQIPWIPVLLEWELDYRPLMPGRPGEAIAPDAVTSVCGWNPEGIDRDAVGGVPDASFKISGAVVLTPHASVDLAQEIDAYTKALSDGPLKTELVDVLAKLRRAPILAQALSGFNQALVMRRQALQLDVKDPENELDFIAAVQATIGPFNDLAPDPNGGFSPIRAGYARLTKLALIDAFGRERDVATGKGAALPANSMLPRDALARGDGFAYLPPRLAQPSRLRFRWLAASDDQVEMNYHPATSPLVGWVMPNFLDDSLMIYAPDGVCLGMLELLAGGTERRWRRAPGPGRLVQSAGAPVDTRNDIVSDPALAPHKHLRDAVLGLFDGGPDYLDGMIRAIDRACTTIVPPDTNVDPSLALLLGRPLALARARIGLDLRGLPAVRRDWDSLKAAQQNTDFTLDRTAMLSLPLRADASFTSVKIDVVLGDFNRADDGLVGYFRNDEYGRFFSPAVDDGAGKVVRPAADPVTVTADPRVSTDAVVTLLLDPRAVVHARAGIVPEKTIAIPPDQYVAAMSSLQAFFYAGPVLANGSSDLPLPVIQGRAWSWLDPAGGTWTARPLTGKTSDRAAIGYSPLALREGWLLLAPAS